jgi:alpha-L-arabinofuranosidase
MGKIARILILLSILFSFSFVSKAQTIADVNFNPSFSQILLPDGTPFLRWSDITKYTRTYHVSQNHPKASDENDGSEERPFLTINHAAQVVKPGERVYIHSGIYRELVRPRFSGDGPEKMISYEAAPGEQVTIRGSRVITTKWKLSVDPHDSLAASGSLKLNIELGFPANSYSKQIRMTTLPDNLFEDGYYPLKIPNTTVAEFDMMNWATRWKGRLPYTLPRCLLFQEGRRMSQLSAYEDLVRLPGSFWVGPDGKTVHIHAFDNKNPNSQLFEIAVQHHIIQPQEIGLGYIRISGLIIEHCANGFLRTGEGALFAMGGHHWIIEDNIVRDVNSLGIEIGTRAYEGRDSRNPPRTSVQGQPAARTDDLNSGHYIVRRNIVFGCGTAGIRGLGSAFALVEYNNISDCGWQDAEFHWEVAGIKLLGARGTLVQNNYISYIQGGCGIWLDFGNQNSRITKNVLQEINTVQGAIFIEASQVPNMVDNNILWNVDGEGVRLADTDSAIVIHNLLANISEEQVVCRVATDRSLAGRKLTSKGNQIFNNIIVDQGKPILSEDPSNLTDYNVYVSTITGNTSAKDNGVHSLAIKGKIAFDENNLLVSWKSALSFPTVPVIMNCELDFFNNDRKQGHNVPGPFQGLSDHVTLNLLDGLNKGFR